MGTYNFTSPLPRLARTSAQSWQESGSTVQHLERRRRESFGVDVGKLKLVNPVGELKLDLPQEIIKHTFTLTCGVILNRRFRFSEES